ncbi:hypothetical protein FVE85_8608 [Porphyridium purpureum]|uniref:Uncharacterized protein n=1 Tax=Porphyridium purpureum TaxID=35688 RepID=A0A5J4YQV5_PORPP|nr:hypothetical protein FVE85_8608 [Porphyridium purpureum]|eukprot:POR2896..scf296_7
MVDRAATLSRQSTSSDFDMEAELEFGEPGEMVFGEDLEETSFSMRQWKRMQIAEELKNQRIGRRHVSPSNQTASPRTPRTFGIDVRCSLNLSAPGHSVSWVNWNARRSTSSHSVGSNVSSRARSGNVSLSSGNSKFSSTASLSAAQATSLDKEAFRKRAEIIDRVGVSTGPSANASRMHVPAFLPGPKSKKSHAHP